MKNLSYLSIIVTIILMMGCRGAASTPTATSTTTLVPTHQIIATLTVTPSITPTATPNIPKEAHLKSQCLEVSPSLPGEVISNGVVVLENRISINGRNKRESYLLDMSSGANKTLEGAWFSITSPDQTLLAYSYAVFDKQDNLIKRDLIITNASGEPLKTIPWNDKWQAMLDWSDNQHLLFGLRDNNGVGKPQTVVVLNPFNGQQNLLYPNFTKFLDIPGTTKLPYWESQYGVIYDPTLTRAIYPRFIGNNQEMYTYAIWDLPKQKLAASLEDIFSASSNYNDIFPMPVWSPDGSRFVFPGVVRAPNKNGESYHVERELYQINQDGQTKQLTHLYPFAELLDTLSWSPNGRYLAGFMLRSDSVVTFDHPDPKVMPIILDTTTLEVTNYCLQIATSGGAGNGLSSLPAAPIWSPDGKQFLISDRDEEYHWRVILVDIEKGTAAQITTDMEAVGWMTKEP